MQRQLHELSKEELIEVVQDYQEMFSEFEELANRFNSTRTINPILDSQIGDDIRDILYKERPGWRIHEKENGSKWSSLKF